MTVSIEKVLQDTTEAAGMVMLTDDPKLFDQLIKPAIDQAVDTLYDYLSNPDEIEITALQSSFAPMIEELKQLPIEQLIAAENKPIALTEGTKTPFLNFTKAIASLQKATSPRLKAAFEEVSDGVSFNDNAAISLARLEHAVKTDTLSELLTMQRQVSNKMSQEQFVGILEFATSDKVIPFMQALARNTNKDDFKAIAYYAAQTSHSVTNELLSDEGIDNLTSDMTDLLEDDSSLGQQMKGMNMLNEKIVGKILGYMTPTEKGLGIASRLIQAFENSAIESGAMTEEQYTDFAKTKVTASLKVMRGYDAMNGFDGKHALGAMTSKRHGGPKAP